MWGQPIKLIQVASNAELRVNQWNDLLFFEIIEEGKQSSAIKVDELKLNASFLNSKKTQDNQEQESADATGETFFYSP